MEEKKIQETSQDESTVLKSSTRGDYKDWRNQMSFSFMLLRYLLVVLVISGSGSAGESAEDFRRPGEEDARMIDRLAYGVKYEVVNRMLPIVSKWRHIFKVDLPQFDFKSEK